MDAQGTFPLVGIGQDSHVFADSALAKSSATCSYLVLGGLRIEDCPPLCGNSDADVVLHALCNAISSITGEPFLGPRTDVMCRAGIIDSASYVRQQLKQSDLFLMHIAVAIEAKRPPLIHHIKAMRQSIASITGIDMGRVGITATSGEGLSAYGRGEGIFANVVVTAMNKSVDSINMPIGNQPLLVLATTPTEQLASRITDCLLTQHLAACVQRVAIQSTFRWEGQVCNEDEYLLLIKTTSKAYSKLQDIVCELHPYTMPQIVSIALDGGLPSYLHWLIENTTTA